MIEIRKLCKSYGSVQILSQVSVTLEDEDFAILYGTSGSGKTTFLRLLAGLEPVSGGEILFDGKIFSAPGILVPPNRRKLGFVFQEPGLWPHLKVSKNILYGCQGTSSERKLKLDFLASECRLKSLLLKYPGQLSMGEKRRVALARALAAKPRYLFLDEAFVNLDQELRNEMIQLVKSMKKNYDLTVIYVTHEQDDLNSFSARIWNCHEMSIVETEP